MTELIACCGLDCRQCDARIATLTNDDALREKTAALWSRLNGVPISKEMIHCTGCRTEGAKTLFCANFCQIRRCVLGKGLETCGSCTGMEACQTLAAITGNNPQALQHLRETGAGVDYPMGAETWQCLELELRVEDYEN